jgi:hypothetical protein
MLRSAQIMSSLADTSEFRGARNALPFPRHILEDHNFSSDKMAA